MSKKCVHCGREIPDGETLCKECGTFQTSEEENAAPGRLKVKFTPIKVFSIIIFLIAAAALTWLISSLNVEIKDAGGFTKSMKIQMTVYNGNLSNIKRLAPNEYWNLLREETEFDIDDYIAELKAEEKRKREEAEAEKRAAEKRAAEEASTDAVESVEPVESESDAEETEKEASYRYEVISSEQFNKKELRFFNKEMKKMLNSDANKLVTDAYRVKYRICLGDKEDFTAEEWNVVSFRIREGWYILKDGKFLIAPGAEDIVIRPEFPNIIN